MITIDTDAGSVTIDDGVSRTFDLASPEGFAIVSKAWLRAGWDAKYVYSFSWLGRPIIQLPDDLIRIQELVYSIRPDLIVETGIAHGGSLVFYAGLCKIVGHGRVIGIDVEIRPHNRVAIENHDLYPYITLIEGSSIDEDVVSEVRAEIEPGATVLVLLDSCHEKEHVLEELRAYGPLVTKGSYIVAMDGIMAELQGAPRSSNDWSWNNPQEAAAEFVSQNPDFVIEDPTIPFNEGMISERVTYWPHGFIRRL